MVAGGLDTLLAFVCYIVLTGGFKEHLEARLNTNSQNLVPSSLLGEGHPIGSARERIAKSIPMFLTESVSVIDLTKEIEPPSDQRTPQNLDQFILGKPSVGYDMTVERKLRWPNPSDLDALVAILGMGNFPAKDGR